MNKACARAQQRYCSIRRCKVFEVKSHWYAHPDCFGESYVVTSDNGDPVLRLLPGTKVDLTPRNPNPNADWDMLTTKLKNFEYEPETADTQDRFVVAITNFLKTMRRNQNTRRTQNREKIL